MIRTVNCEMEFAKRSLFWLDRGPILCYLNQFVKFFPFDISGFYLVYSFFSNRMFFNENLHSDGVSKYKIACRYRYCFMAQTFRLTAVRRFFLSELLFIDSTFVSFRWGIDRKTRDQVFLLKQENSCKSFKDLQEFSKRGVFISLLFLERLSLI